MTDNETINFVQCLISLDRETEWVEFKHNNSDPQILGKNVSAVSNGAALHGKPMGYLIWGVDDEGHQVIGTSFKPHKKKKGNEELENWLLRMLEPRLDIRFHIVEVDGATVVVLKVPAATTQPTRFAGEESIRVGSYTKPLRDFPEKERKLWGLFSSTAFEDGIAAEKVSSDEVLKLIEYPKYFQLMEAPLPDNRKAIMESLCAEEIVIANGRNRFDVTNVGAVLFAKRLSSFERLQRKALRVIMYRGEDRVDTVKEQAFDKGYAVGFESMIRYINDQLPQSEQIEQVFRAKVRTYPEISIRELVANTLIHQDFHISGAGPMVELFETRIEITNPGESLIELLRLIDQPPRSRNEKLAGLMRRMNICEERGTGIDKVISATELYQLPAPDFRAPGDNTVSVLFAPRRFTEMNREERIRACYQHACLMYVSGKRMSNSTLRTRLGIEKKNYPQASKIIRDCIEAKLLKQHEEERTYLPDWA